MRVPFIRVAIIMSSARPSRRHNLSRNTELRMKVCLSALSTKSTDAALRVPRPSRCAALRVPRVADMAVGPISSTPERRLPWLAWCARWVACRTRLVCLCAGRIWRGASRRPLRDDATRAGDVVSAGGRARLAWRRAWCMLYSTSLRQAGASGRAASAARPCAEVRVVWSIR